MYVILQCKTFCGINEDQTIKGSKGYWFRSCSARESATIIGMLAETQKQAEERESFIVEKGKVAGVPRREAAGLGSWR